MTTKKQTKSVASNDKRSTYTTVLAVVVLIFAVGVIYLILSTPHNNPITVKAKVVEGSHVQPSQSKNNTSKSYAVFKEVPANSTVFTKQLENSSRVLLIMDLRNAQDPSVRRNIMQCGVDLAGSPGLVHKKVVIYSLDHNLCYGAKNTTYPVAQCLSQRTWKNTTTFYITTNQKTSFYSHEVVVGIGRYYKLGSCAVNIQSSQSLENGSINTTKANMTEG